MATRTTMLLSLPLQAISMVRRLSWLRGKCSMSMSSQSNPMSAIISTKYGSEQPNQVPIAGSPFASICFNLLAMPFPPRVGLSRDDHILAIFGAKVHNKEWRSKINDWTLLGFLVGAAPSDV